MRPTNLDEHPGIRVPDPGELNQALEALHNSLDTYEGALHEIANLLVPVMLPAKKEDQTNSVESPSTSPDSTVPYETVIGSRMGEQVARLDTLTLDLLGLVRRLSI